MSSSVLYMAELHYIFVSPLNYFLLVSCPLAPNPGDATELYTAILQQIEEMEFEL